MFVYSVREWLLSFSCMWLSSFPRTIYGKYCSFSVVCSCLLYCKLSVCVGVYFWILSSVPLVFCFCFFLIHASIWFSLGLPQLGRYLSVWNHIGCGLHLSMKYLISLCSTSFPPWQWVLVYSTFPHGEKWYHPCKRECERETRRKRENWPKSILRVIFDLDF